MFQKEATKLEIHDAAGLVVLAAPHCSLGIMLRCGISLHAVLLFRRKAHAVRRECAADAALLPADQNISPKGFLAILAQLAVFPAIWCEVVLLENVLGIRKILKKIIALLDRNCPGRLGRADRLLV